MQWLITRGRVVTEPSNTTSSEYVDIVNEASMNHEGEAFNKRRQEAMDRLAVPISSFLYAETEEEADTDAGLIAQLGKFADAARPELAHFSSLLLREVFPQFPLFVEKHLAARELIPNIPGSPQHIPMICHSKAFVPRYAI